MSILGWWDYNVMAPERWELGWELGSIEDVECQAKEFSILLVIRKVPKYRISCHQFARQKEHSGDDFGSRDRVDLWTKRIGGPVGSQGYVWRRQVER